MATYSNYSIKITVSDKFESRSSWRLGYIQYTPVVTSFIFGGYDIETNKWITILNYQDKTESYHTCNNGNVSTTTSTAYVEPDVIRNCSDEECAAYHGWVSDYENSHENHPESLSIKKRINSCYPSVPIFSKYSGVGSTDPAPETGEPLFTPDFSCSWFSPDVLTKPGTATGRGKSKFVWPYGETDEVRNGVSGMVGISPTLEYPSDGKMYSFYVPYRFCSFSIAFSDFKDNIAQKAKVDINIYNDPANRYSEYARHSFVCSNYSIEITDTETVYERGATESYVAYGTFSATGRDDHAVSVDIQDRVKIYNCEGWTFEALHKEYAAGDGTLVPVDITYSPSETSKDVGVYMVNATVSIDNRSGSYDNYYPVVLRTWYNDD